MTPKATAARTMKRKYFYSHYTTWSSCSIFFPFCFICIRAYERIKNVLGKTIISAESNSGRFILSCLLPPAPTPLLVENVLVFLDNRRSRYENDSGVNKRKNTERKRDGGEKENRICYANIVVLFIRWNLIAKKKTANEMKMLPKHPT